MKRGLLLVLLFGLIGTLPLLGRERTDEVYMYYHGHVTGVSLLDCEPGEWRTMAIFPVRDGAGEVVWYAATDALPQEVMDDFDRWVFIRKSLKLVEDAVREEDWEQVAYLTGKIRAYQEKIAGEHLPSAAKIRAEKVYNRIARPKIPFMATLTLGLLLYILTALSLSRGKTLPKGLRMGAIIFSGVLLGYLTLVLGLYWYVSGHAPLTGTYCVMLLVGWFALWATFLPGRQLPMLLPSGLLLSGFTMLLASLSFADPLIAPLSPALQSPLLSVHVLSMMLSYTLFGLVALGGVLGLSVRSASERLREIDRNILYPATGLLAAGIILGSIWAKSAWGSYWSWDPKETWALITLCIYAAVLLLDRMMRRPVWFHIGTIVAFVSVLFTWFGVSYFLGGMHAYA